MTDDVQNDTAQEATQGQEAVSGQPETDQDAIVDEASSPSEETGDDSAAEKPKPKGVQKRIDELTSNWRSAERERDYWRQMAMRDQSQQPQQPQQDAAPPQPATKPEPDTFDSYEDYLDALTEWKVDQREQARQAETQAQQEKQAKEQQAQQFQQKAAEYASQTPDFNDAMQTLVTLPIADAQANAMMEVIADSDMGPQLVHHLGTNPTEAMRIAGLSPMAAARELGRIEARLSMPAPKTTTSAPEPVAPIGAGESTPPNMNDLSTEDWMAKRNAQLRNR